MVWQDSQEPLRSFLSACPQTSRNKSGQCPHPYARLLVAFHSTEHVTTARSILRNFLWYKKRAVPASLGSPIAAFHSNEHITMTRTIWRNFLWYEKRQAFFKACLWCEKRDLNPYGVTTRPSNVRVCQFRHSRLRRGRLPLRRCILYTIVFVLSIVFFIFIKKFLSRNSLPPHGRPTSHRSIPI